MKEFATAIAETNRDEEVEAPDLEFAIDGQPMRVYRPTEGQFALLVMTLGRHQAEQDQFAGIIDFFVSILDEPSKRYVIGRMQSRVDIIPLETIVEVLTWMVEEWSGRPFLSLYGSTPSPPNGGRKSTPTTSKRTSSRSVQTVS